MSQIPEPLAVTRQQAAQMLSAAFKRRIETEKIRQDVQDGAPTNSDGTLNLVHYAAWLAKEMGNGD